MIGKLKGTVVWGGFVPGMVLIGLLLGLLASHRWFALPLLILAGWSANMMRLYRRRMRDGLPGRIAQASALLLMVGKLPEMMGLVGFHLTRLRGGRASLIEYKQ